MTKHFRVGIELVVRSSRGADRSVRESRAERGVDDVGHKLSRDIVIKDTFGKADAGWFALRRHFDRLHAECQVSFLDQANHGEGDCSAHMCRFRGETELEDRDVLVRWKQTTSGLPGFTSLVGLKEQLKHPRITRKLARDADFTGLLPPSPVHAGDAWRVDESSIAYFIHPVGDVWLGYGATSGQDGGLCQRAEPRGVALEFRRLLLVSWGKAVATYCGVVPGTKELVQIDLYYDIVSRVTEFGVHAGTGGGNDAARCASDLGSADSAIESRSTNLNLKANGRLIWDTRENMFERAGAEGELSMEVRTLSNIGVLETTMATGNFRSSAWRD